MSGRTTCACDCRQCHLGYHCSRCSADHRAARQRRGQRAAGDPAQRKARWGGPRENPYGIIDAGLGAEAEAGYCIAQIPQGR